MPLNNLYNNTHRGAMTIFGNSCNVNKDNASGWSPYVFMSTLPTSQVAGYLGNTTTDSNQAYSSSTLNIPSTAVVKFARLAWYSTNNVPNLNVFAPNGTLLNVVATTTYNDTSFYGQNADITSFINTHKSGEYTVGRFNGSGGYANWAIIVIYEESSLPFRYFSAYVGLLAVSAGSPAPLTFTNFITPSSGPVKGYLALYYGASDMEDEASFKVGPTIPNNILGNTSTTVWNGQQPYNKSTNMFPGLICFADCNDPSTIGLINTQSTLATRNVNPYSGQYGTGSRVISDVSGLDISSTLINGQTELYTSIAFAGFGGAHSLIQSVQIDINSANIVPVKAVDKTTANPGDQLTYTMVLQNTGLLNANNVSVVDTLPNGVSFVSGTLQVNGVTVVGSPVPPGYTVGVVNFSSTTTLTFKATVDTVPGATVGLNNAYHLYYDFTPVTTPQVAGGTSNTVTTTIPVAKLSGITKRVNKAFADVNDFIIYTITIPNTGDLASGNVTFIDTIPSGTTYVNNSFTLNGTSIPGANPQTGVNIGSIAISGIATVNFAVQITTVPSPNPIPNSSFIYYTYAGTTVTNTSNSVQTQVNNANLLVSKITSNDFADVNTTITYTVVARNTGNVSATNVFFIDTIPNNTTFVPNSVQVNGNPVSGDPSQPGGINIGSIGGFSTSTITFRIVIDTIPSPNPIVNAALLKYNYTIDPGNPDGGSGSKLTNNVFTRVNHAQLVSTKRTSETYAKCGTTITYTIGISNTGNVSAYGLTFKDTIPNGTVFIPNSFTLNGSTMSGQDPGVGVNIGTITAGSVSTVAFQVKVNC